jgi:hypothetical protein
MKLSRLEKTYLTVLAVIIGGVVVHAPLSVGLGTLFPQFDLMIKSWKEILMLVALVLSLVIITRRELWRELLSDMVVRLIVAFGLLHLMLAAVFYKGAAAVTAGLAIDLRFVLFFGLVYVAMKIAPQYRSLMVKIALIGACIVVGFAALQLFLPADILSHVGYGKDTIAPYLTVDKNPKYIRENSTLRGPNPLGAYAGMVLGLLAATLAKKSLQLRNKKNLIAVIVLGVCSTIALWVSYSRSAWVAGIVTVFAVVAVTVFRKLPRRAWIISCIVIVAVAGGLIASRGSSFVSNVILHENPNGGSSVSSNDGHVQSLESGVSALVRQPLGAGVGSTGSASLFSGMPTVVENQYLFVAHEAGWLGLLLFVALYGLVLWRLWRRRSDWLNLGVFASGIGLGIIGLLLPVWADDTVSIIWWGLAAIALGGSYERK